MPRIKPRSTVEASANGRRAPIVGTILLGLLVALASGAGLWTIHERSREALDHEMGERMLLIAEEIAAAADPIDITRWSLLAPEDLALDIVPFLLRVEEVAEKRGLNYAVVYDYDGDVLLDTSGLRSPGELDLYLFGAEAQAALSYEPVHLPTAATPQGEYLKSAFFPVFDGLGDQSDPWHVAVHAAPDFFETMRTLQRTLIGVGVALLLLLGTAITVYLFYAQRLARAHVALARSEQLSAMGRMAAGIAHEIRNPLGIIKNTAQLLREELRDAQVETDLVEYIPEEVDRLNETLTGYLEFAKDAPLRLERVDLAKLVRRTLELVKRDVDGAGIEVRHDLGAAGEVILDADSRKLQQVVLNLVLNAVQAMPGGGTLAVGVGPPGDGVVVLRVEDTGVGMDAAKARQIFEPFFTSKEKGSGLGLHVVQRIVEDHGGGIELETEVGVGTTFIVTLPVSGPASQEA